MKNAAWVVGSLLRFTPAPMYIRSDIELETKFAIVISETVTISNSWRVFWPHNGNTWTYLWDQMSLFEVCVK